MYYMLGIIFTISVLCLSGCSLLPKEAEEEQLPPIAPPSISKKPEYDVKASTLEQKVSASGKMMSQREEKLYFGLEGAKNISELFVKAGDQVKKGQVIAKVDLDDLNRDIRSKQREVTRAEVELKKNLSNRDEMDPSEYQEKVFALEDAKQNLSDAQKKAAKGVIKAPFAGMIVDLKGVKGAAINKPFETIATIVDTSSLVVAVHFSKEDLEHISIGMPAYVEINGITEKVSGKIQTLPTKMENGENRFSDVGQTGSGDSPPEQESTDKYTLIRLDKTPKELVRGTQLSATVVYHKKENTILIPLSVLRSVGGRNYVQVVEKDGSKREVDVELGHKTATEVEIIKGLTSGQKVVGR